MRSVALFFFRCVAHCISLVSIDPHSSIEMGDGPLAVEQGLRLWESTVGLGVRLLRRETVPARRDPERPPDLGPAYRLWWEEYYQMHFELAGEEDADRHRPDSPPLPQVQGGGQCPQLKTRYE